MRISDWARAIEDVFEATPVMPVVKIDRVADAVPMAQALLSGGISAIEVTLRSDAALAAVAAIRKSCPAMTVGVGTVITPAQADAAIDAGASFLVSPGILPSLVDRARDRETPLLPAAVTGSEICLAINLGLSRLKFFPAEAMGGRTVLKALYGPFADIRFCPTGGISLANLPDYLREPNVMGVGGSWIVPAALADAGRWDEVAARAREAVAVAGTR